MVIRRKVKRVLDKDTFETHRKVNGSNFIRIAGDAWSRIKHCSGQKTKGSDEKKNSRQDSNSSTS